MRTGEIEAAAARVIFEDRPSSLSERIFAGTSDVPHRVSSCSATISEVLYCNPQTISARSNINVPMGNRV